MTMRITNGMLINNMVGYMGNNLNRMNKYQYQMATGMKITVPSDDPIVAARALKLRTDVAQVDQYQRNIKDAQSWLDTTEDTLGSIGTVLQRVRELAVQAANGTNTPDDMQKIGQEVKQLKGQMVQLANTSYAGRYIFSGYKTDQKLVNDDGSFNLSVQTGNEQIKYEVGISDDIIVNLEGGDVFNAGGDAVAGPPAQTGKLFQDMDTFMTALNAGDNKTVSSLIQSFEDDIGNILRVRADIGARQNRMELTADRMDNDYVNFTKLMSDNENVDVAETIMNLKNEENVYRSSLSAGARIIQPTLVDFLR